MIEVLPIRLLTDQDALVFGPLNVSLGKLGRSGFPVAPGIVLTPPHLKLKTTLENFNFGSKEVFQQSLTLVKKEINKIPVSEILTREVGKHKQFLLNGEKIKGVKAVWSALLNFWLDQIKARLWNNGFFTGITDNLDPKVVIFIKDIKSHGIAYEDSFQDDVMVSTKSGKLHPTDLKRIVELIKLANKKLFIPNEYEWMVDKGVKLVGIKPYTFSPVTMNPSTVTLSETKGIVPDQNDKSKSAVKVFFDLSLGLTIEKEVDGVYIASEKIFDLNKPNDSFENLDFARHKKGLTNIHIVIPFVRGVNELLQVKRELSTKKLMRKASLEYWMEVAVPENVINMEEYLMAGIDGVVLNLDELIAHLNGFDPIEADLAFYKNEVEGLIKFLEDGIRLLHKSKIPFIAYGSLNLYPKVLEFLVEKGVYGVVAEKYEAHSTKDLLYQVERRIVLRNS